MCILIFRVIKMGIRFFLSWAKTHIQSSNTGYLNSIFLRKLIWSINWYLVIEWNHTFIIPDAAIAATQSSSVWQEQSTGCVDETSFTGSKWRLHAIVWFWASVALDPVVMKRKVRISKVTFCPNSVWTTFNLCWDKTNFLVDLG